MAVLAGLFGNNEEQEQDSDKLLNLYWNRAELKKEFAGLRKEQFRLQDQVKQQEGATARLQQKLEYLENLLIDPEWSASVVVFYQLRGLAQRCERKLSRFAEQLKQQREQKQHNSLLVGWNDERTRETRVVERSLAKLREQVAGLEEKLNVERARLVSMSGFLRIFRRRSVAAVLDGIRTEMAEAQQQELELLDQLQQIKDRRPPENQGLDIPTKRSINSLILAYAQQLYLHLDDADFAVMVKEANDKSVGAVRYGGPAECEHMLKRIQRRIEAMERSNDVASVLQTRSRLIAEKATYRAEDDAVPVATSVATLFDIDGQGQVTTSKANLLGENYWGVAKYLSR